MSAFASIGSFVFSVRFVYVSYAAGFLFVAVMLFGMTVRSALRDRRLMPRPDDSYDQEAEE